MGNMPRTWTPTEIDKQYRRDGEAVPPDNIEEFGERYEVFPQFIPFESRNYSPLERFRMIREFIEDMTEYKPAFTTSEITKFHELENGQTLAGLNEWYFYAVGSRPLEREAHKGRIRYANPNHVHKDSVEPVTVEQPEKTVELARKYAMTGMHSLTDIAPYFKRDYQELSLHLSALLEGTTYAELREQGREKMARTFHIIREWKHPASEIGDAFGMAKRTVNRWIMDYSKEQGFQVPDDPTSPHGYRYAMKYNAFR